MWLKSQGWGLNVKIYCASVGWSEGVKCTGRLSSKEPVFPLCNYPVALMMFGFVLQPRVHQHLHQLFICQSNKFFVWKEIHGKVNTEREWDEKTVFLCLELGGPTGCEASVSCDVWRWRLASQRVFGISLPGHHCKLDSACLGSGPSRYTTIPQCQLSHRQ